MTEIELYRYYMELGRKASEIESERRAIRESEIIPLLDAGVVLGENGKYLKLTYKARTAFDVDTAIQLGYLTPAQVAECSKTTGWKEVRETKMDETEAEREAAINAMRARLSVSIGGVPTFDGEPVKVEVKA